MLNVFRSRKKGVTQQDTQKRTDTLYPKVYSRKSTKKKKKKVHA